MGWRERRQDRRVEPGDGRPLPRYRWWQVLTRSLFSIDLVTADGRVSTYAVDIRQLGDGDDGAVRARLYVDGTLHLVSRVPARLPVPGGVIEVVVGSFGIKRCHLVADGTQTQLVPHPRSAEGRRARLDRDHPSASRVVGVLATVAVLVGLAVTVPEIIEPISQVPPIAENLGTFDSPFDPPLWLAISLGAGAVLGSVERALRLRSSWLDNLAS